MSGPDASGFCELGIDASDADLHAAAGTEVTIVEEAAVLQAKARAKRATSRRRAGPLPVAEREIIVREATSQLKRALLALVLATDQPGEIHSALALAGLEVRRFPPGYDALAASLQKNL